MSDILQFPEVNQLILVRTTPGDQLCLAKVLLCFEGTERVRVQWYKRPSPINEPLHWIPEEEGTDQTVDLQACTFPINAEHHGGLVVVDAEEEGGPVARRTVETVEAGDGPDGVERVGVWKGQQFYRGTRNLVTGAVTYDGGLNPRGFPTAIPWNQIPTDLVVGDQGVEVWTGDRWAQGTVLPRIMDHQGPTVVTKSQGGTAGAVVDSRGLVRKPPGPPTDPVAVGFDLFCGIGGNTLGLIMAGVQVLGGFDNSPDALRTYSMNMPAPGFHVDIRDVDRVCAVMHAQLQGRQCDLLTGCPPCQDFSNAGKGEEGENAAMTGVFGVIVAAMRPSAFMMENVPQVRKSEAWKKASLMLKNCGYDIVASTVHATQDGVPQSRRRTVIVGILKDRERTRRFTQALERLQPEEAPTVGQVLGLDGSTKVFQPAKFGKDRTFPASGYACTLMCDCLASCSDEGKHVLTCREAQQLQGLPACFEFPEDLSRTAKGRLLGNAVPCQVVKRVAETLFGDGSESAALLPTFLVGRVEGCEGLWVHYESQFELIRLKPVPHKHRCVCADEENPYSSTNATFVPMRSSEGLELEQDDNRLSSVIWRIKTDALWREVCAAAAGHDPSSGGQLRSRETPRAHQSSSGSKKRRRPEHQDHDRAADAAPPLNRPQPRAVAELVDRLENGPKW